MFHIPKSEGVQEEIEFKKNLTWSTTLGLRRVYLPVWKRKSQSWRDHDEPSHNYKMTAKNAIMIHYPRVAACLYCKKSSTWSTTLGLRHVYLPICGRKSQVTSSRHIVVCLLAKNHMKLLYICTCVFLIFYDILEYVYHSACDKKISVHLDPTLYSANTYSVSMYLN